MRYVPRSAPAEDSADIDDLINDVPEIPLPSNNDPDVDDLELDTQLPRPKQSFKLPFSTEYVSSEDISRHISISSNISDHNDQEVSKDNDAESDDSYDATDDDDFDESDESNEEN